MRKIRLAVVGTGQRARDLIELYRLHEMVDIVAVCDRNQTALGLASKVAPDAATYRDYETMMREVKPDAVFVAINPFHQVEMACDAMERGAHVMTEVPATFTLEECEKLVKTVEKTGMKYQLAEQTRYWDFIVKWREMARRGEFGKLLRLQGEYLHFEKRWEVWEDPETGDRTFYGDPKPEGAVKAWRHTLFAHPIYYLPHTLSPLTSIVDSPITKVCCFAANPGSEAFPLMDGNVRDFETAIMHTESGAVLTVSASFTAPDPARAGTYHHWYAVQGTQGAAEWTRNTVDKPKLWRNEGEWKDSGGVWSDQDWTTENADMPEVFRKAGHGGVDFYPIDTFAKAIVNDTVPPVDVYTTVGFTAPAICAAMSAETGGKVIEVPDFRRKKA